MGKTIAMLHPGEMGSGVAACLVNAGHRVLWSAAGRSEATRARAKAAGLVEAPDLPSAVRQADMVFSICPPHAALDVAREVAACGFKGVYVDANAVAPATVLEVARVVGAAGARCVDGGIIGAPPAAGVKSRLSVSGEGAKDIAALFSGSYLVTTVLEGPAGAASALKMCYAGWTKGSMALLADVRALATAHGVDAALLEEWKLLRPTLIQDSEMVRGAARKAWRWVGEMEEIAATYEAVGLPGNFHLGAARIYERLVAFKDTPKPPEMGAVLQALGAKRH